MELGEKLKQARLEAGLSQRQLCGDEITQEAIMSCIMAHNRKEKVEA